jgi:hypothetical protein
MAIPFWGKRVQLIRDQIGVDLVALKGFNKSDISCHWRSEQQQREDILRTASLSLYSELIHQPFGIVGWKVYWAFSQPVPCLGYLPKISSAY